MGNTLSYRRDLGLIVVGAILFTASFLWKDLITEIEETYFPKINGIGARIVFTIIVTIILVIIAVEMKDFFGISSSKRKLENKIQFDDEPINELNDDKPINELNDELSVDETATLDMAALGFLGDDHGMSDFSQ